ncbi:MAG: hypothetical protein IPG22_07325 [Acidobacteria bacterium]|nr:hypothetical protein [Acidobacteriota bacterium]
MVCENWRGSQNKCLPKKEARIYTHLEGNHALLFGFFIDIPSGSILGLENLSSAEWNIKWTKHCVASVISRLDEVSRLKFPFKIPRLEHLVADFKSWNSIDSAGIEVLGTILGCSDWICDIEAFLRELSSAASFKGHEMVHFDVRIDNMCFRDGRLILIDWDWLSIGNPVLDILTLLPGVYLSGGPHPHDVIKEEYELVSWLAGAWGLRFSYILRITYRVDLDNCNSVN